jgi:hypothetical protein
VSAARRAVLALAFLAACIVDIDRGPAAQGRRPGRSS